MPSSNSSGSRASNESGEGNQSRGGSRRSRESSPSTDDDRPVKRIRPIVLTAKKRTTDEYAVVARLITRTRYMLWEPFACINAGLRLLAMDDPDEMEAERESASPKMKMQYEIFMITWDRIPGLVDTTNWDDIRRRLDTGKIAARTEDNHVLKRDLPKMRQWDPPLKSDSKADRGLNHPECAMLLAPISVNWDNEEEQDRFRNQYDPPMSTNELWPAFLYLGYKADLDNMATGLLRSDLMVRAARTIIFPPSVANAENHPDHRSNRKTKAEIYGMDSVTPGFLAYVAVCLRFALSSEAIYQSKGRLFDYDKFYGDIVAYLHDPICKHDTDELIAWWNSTLLPKKHADPVVEPDSMVARLRRQAEARQED